MAVILCVYFMYRKGKKILTTGFGCLNHEDNVTRDGLKTVFATNLFGHYVMVRLTLVER